MYHHIPVQQILLPEIANGNEWFSRHLSSRNDGPNGNPRVCTSIHVDDLLCITRRTLEDHLDKLEEVLRRLRDAGLKVNAVKSFFCTHKIEYLGYMLTRGGIKPQIKKVQAILAINPPNNVKELRHFLGMVQYYRDMWAKRSEMLAPLSDLVGECKETKTTRKNKVKKKPWHWDSIHQEAFDNIKKTIAKEVVLAYPDFTKPFDIYTDASTKQLGAVITQDNRPIVFSVGNSSVRNLNTPLPN